MQQELVISTPRPPWAFAAMASRASAHGFQTFALPNGWGRERPRPFPFPAGTRFPMRKPA